MFAAWYPIKRRAPVRQFLTDLQQSGIRGIVAAELCLREPVDPRDSTAAECSSSTRPIASNRRFRLILTALLDRLGDREPGEVAQRYRHIVDE